MRYGSSTVGRLGPNHHELIRFRIRHRFEHSVDHAEDRRRRSDTQRERQDRRQRKTLILQQRPERKADVLFKTAEHFNFC